MLRSWYGECKPESIALTEGLVPTSLDALYTFEAYSFGTIGDAVVAGFFGVPRTFAAAPTLLGFAARGDLHAALAAAFNESLQSLGFLWGEALPTRAPLPSATPDFHQDYFRFPAHLARLHAWLQGDHSRYYGILETHPLAEPHYVDLTPPHLASRLSVVRAIPAGHVPLAFGTKHPFVRTDAPPELWVHPIA